ncbi:MAG: Glycerol-3-phosphate dehydrogenase [NAD(P)+] [Alphaproteobacteria bacterium MarineAlpha2_Bin1]|nr:MAG: Glycerol-3-phosphate dehydrogenase [NAD(P)+] [Alphaproteobacteria bacterium MarineAlpha2_Bin1]|tara:strand:- start:668 stop:1666 length:999 start_codon:yes stop_codon:yes gene_type:complete
MSNCKIGIVGGGAWGTALGSNLSINNKNVLLWSRNKKVVNSINEMNYNKIYLPNIKLNKNLKSTDAKEKFRNFDILIFVVPTQHIRSILNLFKNIISNKTTIINCSKGIERKTLLFPSSIFEEQLPRSPFAILSGPTFASEVAKGKPSALTLACNSNLSHNGLAKKLSSDSLRFYFSDDLNGVELGGAVKNIIAIAAGITYGANLGENARAALISRGLAEINRLGMALGARSETLMGLSGLGDLILTANSIKSRNFSLGNALGQGIRLNEYLSEKNSITEGLFTTEAAVCLAEKLKVEIPIIKAVNFILKGKKDLKDTLKEFYLRPFKFENE